MTLERIKENYIIKWALPFVDDKFDYNFFINKKIYHENKFYNCIGFNIINKGFKNEGISFNFFYNNLIINKSLRLSYFMLYNPITDNEEKIGVYRLLKQKYFVPQKIFKSEYYITNEYLNKKKKTCIEKFGVEHQLQNEEIKNKVKQTNNKKYGVDWFLQRGNHYDLIDEIMIEKYGFDNCFKNEEIHAKCISKKITSKEFLEKKDFFKNKRIQQKILHKGGKAVSKFEIKAIEWILSEFNFKKPCFYNINEDNYQCVIKGNKISKKYYKVDFYDPELNIIIEFLGDYWHANPEKYTSDSILNFGFVKLIAEDIWVKDEKRRNEIIEQTGCIYVEIWENDFNNNREKIKKIFYEFFENKKNK